MNKADFITWAPVIISGLLLLIAGISIYISAKSFSFSREEFFASRTTILSCSLRPNLSEEIAKKFELLNKEKNQEEYLGQFPTLLREGLKNAILAFVPSLKPNFIHECKLIISKNICENNEFTISNISADSITQKLVEQKIITEGDFGVPATFVTSKFDNFLKKMTPDRHKVGFGTFNHITLPLIVEIIILAKGRKYHEKQLYSLTLGFQVSEQNECLIRGFTIDYKRRIGRKENLPRLLDVDMKNIDIHFNEPL